MQNFFAGQWQSTAEQFDVRNPYDQTVIDTVPKCTATQIAAAVDELEKGRKHMERLTPFERGKLLDRVCVLMSDRAEEFARCISSESGKTIREARSEVQRGVETLRLSAEEARRLCGEMIPLEGAANGQGKLGFTLRIPCGIVAAITPFNFPLNLVTHKLGPAIAGGNAILIKPASTTPLTALKLVEVLLEAGLPEQAIACVTGSGSELGHAICADKRIRKISFTGSLAVGEQLCKTAGLKKVTLELGGNGPVVVLADADLKKVAAAVAVSGYANAGQVCISTQRVLIDSKSVDEFQHLLSAEIDALQTGNPSEEATRMGTMIDTSEADRVQSWVDEAVSLGARLIRGGQHSGTCFEPTLLSGITSEMKLGRDELFGPAVGITTVQHLDEAIDLVNQTPSGLACGLFTQDLDRAFQFAKQVRSGNININGTSQFRVDHMPYGGIDESGIGKEGPYYAIREMTEEKMITLHLNSLHSSSR